MSKIVGFIVGATLIAIGVVTGNVGLIIEGSALIITQAVADLTMPKTPAREASEMSIALGEQPRVALFGETDTPGSLVDGFNYGGKYGTDWEVLVIRLADHKCEGLTGFYVNDLYVAYTGDGLYPAFNTDHLAVYFRADTTATALPSIVTTYGPGWTSADVGQSGCDVIVAYRADEPKNKHPVWPGGRPHFSWVVKGKRCYDPRKDSTVGGSGSHLWTDASTWEYSANPAVCRYNWARGIFANDEVTNPAALLIGRGLTAAEAPPANIFAAANLCDETVGSGVRYRVAGPVYANQTFIDVEQMFAIACAGSVITHEGDVQLEPGQSKSIVATITDADLLVGGRVSWNQGILSESSPEWVNTVVVNYIEPTQQWASHQAPPARSVADIIADGRPREAQVALRLVKDLDQAQRVAEILRRLGRLWGRAGVTLGPRFCELEEGDWINWQSDRYFGGGTKTFRIEAYTIDQKWQNSLTLREIDASVFDGVFAFASDQSVATPTTPPPAIGSPGGSQWALAAVTLSNAGASVPALEITGSASDDVAVEEIVVEYWKSDGVINPLTNPDDPPWIMEGSHPPTMTKVDITSIQGGQDYYAAVSYVVSGITGDRRVLGPVTAASIDVTGQVGAGVYSALGWFNVKSYGAVGNGTTDDTTAVQSAINACATAGGGVVYFPRGVYIVAGALQDTGRSNAQLLLPIVNCPSTEPITIELRGECAAPSNYSVVGSEPIPDNLSVIKGTLNTASGTAPCLIGAHGPSGSFDDFTNVNVVLRDLTFRMPPNPALTAVDCSLCVALDADNVLIDGGNWNISTIALQSTAASYGLKAPGRDNGASTRLGIVTIIGFYNGLQVGEHTRGLGVNIAGCRQATVWPVQDHASQFDRLLVVWCQKAMVITGQHYFDIQQLDIEHAASGTWVPVYDIDDGSNFGHGNLRWHVVLAGIGVSTSFTVNGGANINYRGLDATSPASIASADGSITVTNPTGPTIDLAVVKAPKWSTARTLTLTGDASGAASLDGSANQSLGVTLASSGVAPGTYHNAIVTVNAKGIVTAVSEGTAGAYLPLVTGAEPPVLVSDGKGDLITVAYNP